MTEYINKVVKFVRSKKYSKKRNSTHYLFLFGGLRFFYIPTKGIGKIDAEWTNEAEAVYRYCESARLFIAKRIQKKKSLVLFYIQ